MKNKLFFTLLSIFLSMMYSQAQLSKTIEVTTPGTLSQQLGTDKTKVTDLTLTGTINDTDFQTLKTMTLLNSLDMSATTIVSKTIPGSTFVGKTFTNLVLSSTLETISNNVFEGTTLSQPLVLPSSLKTIGANAFKNATVEKLDFSACTNLQSAANWAFVGLSSTQSVDFSRCTALTTFGSYAFQLSTSHIILPANLVNLGTVTFSGFNGAVVLPGTLETIGSNAFENAVLSQPLVLPSNLKTLAINAFKNATVYKLDFSACSNLQSVGNWAFNSLSSTQPLDLSQCTALTTFGTYIFQYSTAHVILPSNMINLSVFTFSGFNGTVDLPSTLETIGNNAFNGATLSQGITLPASLKSIGISAFANAQIEKIEAHPITPPTLGATVFSGVNTTTCKLIVPEESLGRYQAAPQWKDFTIEAKLPEPPQVGSFKIAFFEKGGNQLLDTKGGTYIIHFPDERERIIVTGETYFGEPLEDLPFGEYIVREITPPAGYKPSEHPIQIVNLNENNLYTAAEFEYEKIPVVEIPQTVDLYYTENSGTTVLAEYKGVRIGEYYWMKTPFMGNHIALSEPGWTGEYVYLRPWRTDYQNSMTVENVNLLHHRLLMFENARLESDRTSYFDQLLPGASNAEKMIEFEKYYGTYLTRGHIQWMYDARPWVKILVEGEKKEDKSWDLPIGYDIRQLLAMCGNGTTAEVRQYLSYGYDQEDAPSVAKIAPENYFDWFYHNPVHFGSQTNGFNASNTNKYGFGMFPSGSKFHDASTYRPLTQADANEYVISKGEAYPYQTKRGDFTGLNQTFALALHGSQSFILHDYPEIRSEKSYHWTPIRWCRQLTNEELGYRLYINQTNFTDSREALVALKSKIASGETVIIEKLSLDQSPSAGFIELPRGYLRGFYVQYILGKSTPEKTIPQIVDIALQNPYIWGANNAPASQSVSTKAVEVGNSESSDLKIYPNPVTDILYLESGELISEVRIYSTNGKMVLTQANVGSSVNVNHLASGTYILKLQIGDKTRTYKIIKK